MRLPWHRHRLPELELVEVELTGNLRVGPLYWLKELPDGRYEPLLRAFDKTPPHAIATEDARAPGYVWILRPKR